MSLRETFQKLVLHKVGDERHALHRDGETSVIPLPRMNGRREGHIYGDGITIIPQTRGQNAPHKKKGVTFRRGPDHFHPVNSDGSSAAILILTRWSTG